MNAEQYYLRHSENHDRANPDAAAKIAKKSLWQYRTDLDIAYGFLEPLALRRFLDIGCADLEFLLRIKNRAEELCGVDIVPWKAWELNPEIKTQVIDLDQSPLPFDNGVFDAATMIMVLEHVFDPFHAVREVSRVLRPGGHFILGVPNIAYIKHRLSIALGRLPVTSDAASWEKGAWDGFHLHNFTLDSLIWLLGKQGNFRVIGKAGSGKFSRMRSLWPSLLTADLVLHCVREQ